MNHLFLVFDGTNTPRDILLEETRAKLIDFTKEIPYWNSFLMVISEMIKNIYDHANGEGYALLEKDINQISFEITDLGKNKFDYEKALASGRSSKNTKYNFGIGLQTIKEICENLQIKLEITQSDKSLSYKGVWEHNKR